MGCARRSEGPLVVRNEDVALGTVDEPEPTVRRIGVGHEEPMADRADANEIAEQLPDDPVVLSHLVAATASLTVADRQRLLAAPDTAARLRAELALLHREVNLLAQVRAVPLALSELPVTPGPN